jgi:hypothetical protein
MSTPPKEVWVKHSVVDGAHFFTGADPFSQGLCVAHQDLKKAFDEVHVQLKNLAEVNFNIHAEFVPAAPFEEFESDLKQTASKTKAKPFLSFELEKEVA